MFWGLDWGRGSKFFRALFYTQETEGKIKDIFGIILILCHLANFGGHCGCLRPYIHKRSNPAGQQLQNLKSHKVTSLYLAYKITEKKLKRGVS